MFKRWNFKSASFRRMRVEAKRNDGWGLYKTKLAKQKADKEKLKEIERQAGMSQGERIVLDTNKRGLLCRSVKIRIKNISSGGKFNCRKCESDLWMVVDETYLNSILDLIYCQNCGKLLRVPECGFFKSYIGYNDFKKLIP